MWALRLNLDEKSMQAAANLLRASVAWVLMWFCANLPLQPCSVPVYSAHSLVDFSCSSKVSIQAHMYTEAPSVIYYFKSRK